MLQLSKNVISLNNVHNDASSAIQSLAADLSKKGYVDEKYVEGMLARESQNTTFLGNGIAIPHGTTDTRSLVKQTGLVVHHYPKGVNWGNGNVTYLAIGIAAKSDEHLDILRQLTKVLSQDGVESALKSANTAEQIIDIINGNTQLACEFDASLIQTDFPAKDLLQLSAVGSALIKNATFAGNQFVADIVSKTPTHLGKGLWMITSDVGVTKTAMSIVTTSHAFSYKDQPVAGLITFAVNSFSHKSQLDTIQQIIVNQQQQKVLASSQSGVLALFAKDEDGSSSDNISNENEDECVATYTIKNAHGLHARPGAMLVAEAKKFTSNIKVENLDLQSAAVNAKSLMKVIALGVKRGHRLKFTAQGEDASQALESIGAAIDSGLGEQ
ncbi:fused PTS fructose transporter subunit IIA/HPr protein [Vibrio sp. S4M6]|uniref:fused PTS fructose transporter subunit IIA/HPr protein n=1 Tax=Vibrio sinus TaxID=2946865 RepID=UPI002029CB74|nr:fused PTS fructose transporter subunit IIA/HPr protein [Vibrio sinus]MCL9779849.1 fused PTS fructose transporter subunit IIA/HPr protein [Vibrio sinus]